MIPLSFPYRDMGMIRESYTLHSTKNAGIDTQLLYDEKKVISADSILKYYRVVILYLLNMG